MQMCQFISATCFTFKMEMFTQTAELLCSCRLKLICAVDSALKNHPLLLPFQRCVCSLIRACDIVSVKELTVSHLVFSLQQTNYAQDHFSMSRGKAELGDWYFQVSCHSGDKETSRHETITSGKTVQLMQTHKNAICYQGIFLCTLQDEEDI